MCSGLGKQRKTGHECFGCVCVSLFHSSMGPKSCFGVEGCGSHSLPAAPTCTTGVAFSSLPSLIPE